MAALIHQELTHQILAGVFAVHNSLGPGLLEATYEAAMRVELAHRGIAFECQKRYPVRHRGELVGDYFADLVVAGPVILALKSVRAFTDIMRAQPINYLRISGVSLRYLINFHGPRAEWRRLVCEMR